jgi:PII-like signaling protein
MSRAVKKLFLVRDLPVFIEASDEVEALMIFETAMETVQRTTFSGIVEVQDEESASILDTETDPRKLN